jgi:hypothetical protein
VKNGHISHNERLLLQNMSQTTNSSVFAEIESAAPIEVFQLISTYNEDIFPQKVNLGVGGLS